MKNLIIRTLTGAIFVAVIVGGIYFGSYSFLILFCLIVGLSLWEFYGLMKCFQNTRVKRIISTLGGIYLFFATYMYTNKLWSTEVFLPYIIFLMYIFIVGLYDKKSNPVDRWVFTFLGQVYCAASFSLLNFIVVVSDTSGMIVYSPVLVLALFIFVWLNDTGAYLFGITLGKHKLFERISPKKSWEGFGGGMVVALGASQLFHYFIPEVSRFNWLGLSAVIVVFATWGDLTESLLKRTFGVKDSGNILPGHGGLLDRLDSIMMSIPAMYIYLELFIRN